jgi:hypothetical protein
MVSNISSRSRIEKADHLTDRLLRVRYGRPRRCASQQRDEFAPFN